MTTLGSRSRVHKIRETYASNKDKEQSESRVGLDMQSRLIGTHCIVRREVVATHYDGLLKGEVVAKRRANRVWARIP